MSIQTSEIVSALNRAIEQGVAAIHNQTMNDVQGIVGNSELRMMAQLAAIEARLAALEAQRRHLPPEQP